MDKRRLNERMIRPQGHDTPNSVYAYVSSEKTFSKSFIVHLEWLVKPKENLKLFHPVFPLCECRFIQQILAPKHFLLLKVDHCTPLTPLRSTHQPSVSYLPRGDDPDWHLCHRRHEQHRPWTEDPYF